jgi:hypothetical protein
LDLFVLDGQLPVYFARLPASGFEDSGGRNRKLAYRPESSGSGVDGVRRARIVRDALLDDVRVRVDVVASDLRLDELDAVTLVLVFAPAATADCASAVAMPCKRSQGKLTCRSN